MAISYLYIIAAGSSGPVKLGVSRTPDRRLKQLQTGHPEVLTMYHREVVEPELAYYLEGALHKDLHHRRLRGEWFDLTVEQAIGHVQFTFIHYEPSVLSALPAVMGPVGG